MPLSLLDQPTVYGVRAKLGVIVPPTNTANEAEWNRIVPAGVSVHSARMPLHLDTESAAGQAALYRDIERFAADLAQADVSVIVYACTAGSMITPVTALGEFITQKTGIAALTTAQAIVAALQALKVTKIAVATPYHDALNEHEARFLTAQGFEVVSLQGLGYGENGPAEFRNIARIQPDTVIDLAHRVNQDDAEAILISCTDLASLPVIDLLEKKLNKPVISSNSATLWAALRAAGINDSLSGFGLLYDNQ